MKAWTHKVFCEETRPAYSDNYSVRAVKIRGRWLLCERKLGLKYGQPITVIRVERSRKSFAKL